MSHRRTVLAAALSLLVLGSPLMTGCGAQTTFGDGVTNQSTGLDISARDVLMQEITDLTKAIELNPKDANAYSDRGIALGQLGSHETAIADFTKVLEIDPLNFPAYVYRGNEKYELGDYQAAIEDYSKAIEMNPQLSAYTYNNRGNAKTELKDYQGAIADFNQAIEINPQLANVYYNRGYAKGVLENYQDAIADYSKAIEIDPQYIDAYSNRGKAKGIGLSDDKGACSDFKKAASLGDEYRINWLNSEGASWCRNMQ